MQRDGGDPEAGSSPTTPHQRHKACYENVTREQVWHAAAPVVLQPAVQEDPVMLGCMQLPPKKITRKLIRFIIGYLLCMATSLMIINWAMSQLPGPATLSKAGPPGSPELIAVWSLPRSFEDLHQMQATLNAYRTDYFPQLMRAFCFLYLFMQCFTVPGCFFLTVLLGSLLPHVPATIVATVLITFGCMLNYQLSRYIISDVMLFFIPDRVRRFQQAVADQGSHNLFSYMLFLRVIAVVPSWMVNLASPLAKVPFSTFVATTVIGFQPQIFIMISGGGTLSRIHSWQDMYTWQTMLTLAACAVLSVLPVALRRFYDPAAGASGTAA